MAQATTTTDGEIVLSGDLTGDAFNPELRASGVTPGTYPIVRRLSVDSKGRVTSVGQLTSAEMVSYAPDATTSSKGVVSAGATIATASGTISIQDATPITKGAVRIGAGLISPGGVLTIADATTSTKGVVQVGAGLAVSGGVVSLAAPDATTSTKGIVRVGAGLVVSSGAVSAPDATTSTKGIVQIGGGLSVSAGVVSAPDATTSTKGVVQVGAGLAVSGGVVSLAAPDATTSTKGIVQVGSNLFVTNGVVSRVVDATTTSKGVVQINTANGLSISDGVMSYAQADATSSTKGVVLVGGGLEVSGGVMSRPAASDATTDTRGIVSIAPGETRLAIAAGVISATIPDGSSSTAGLVRGGGANILANAGTIQLAGPFASAAAAGPLVVGNNLSATGGVLSIEVPDATTSLKGIAQIGDNLTVNNSVVSANLGTVSAPGVLRVFKDTIWPEHPNNGLEVTSGVISAQIRDAISGARGLVQVGAGISVGAGQIFIPDATGAAKGVVQIGSGVDVTAGEISIDTAVPNASASERGMVILGEGFTNAPAGILQLKTANQTVTGGFVVGSGLSVSGGVLSATPASISEKGVVRIGSDFDTADAANSVLRPVIASGGSIGVVRVDGTTLQVASGTIERQNATTSSKGIVRVGSGLSVSSAIISANVATVTNAGLVIPDPAFFSVSSGVLTSLLTPITTTPSTNFQSRLTRFRVTTNLATGAYNSDFNVIHITTGFSTIDVSPSDGVTPADIDLFISNPTGVNLNPFVLSYSGHVQWENGTVPTLSNSTTVVNHIRLRGVSGNIRNAYLVASYQL